MHYLQICFMLPGGSIAFLNIISPILYICIPLLINYSADTNQIENANVDRNCSILTKEIEFSWGLDLL